MELRTFTHAVSHELQAPLMAVECLARWIEDDSGDTLSESSVSHLRKMRQRVDQDEAA